MANNEFKSIDQFIEGFTRCGHTPENFLYDGVIYGIEFKYKDRIFRITRDSTGRESELKQRFNKTSSAYIQFFEIPIQQYPDASGIDIDLYLGFFDSINELLDEGNINGIKLRDILVSEETVVLAID